MQVIANKLLLVLYSPILRELLMSEKSSNSTAISLPLSTEAIMALLDLLAKGRTFSSQDAHLLEVVKFNGFVHFQYLIVGRWWTPVLCLGSPWESCSSGAEK